jgi:hypothetical protein
LCHFFTPVNPFGSAPNALSNEAPKGGGAK